MKIFGMGGIELVIILVVILLIFGPKNLPKLGSAFGKTVSNLRAGMNEGKKKKEEEEAAASEATEPEAVVAELEGEIEEVAEDFEGSTSELADEVEGAASEAAESPKKVRRVVRKKVNTD